MAETQHAPRQAAPVVAVEEPAPPPPPMDPPLVRDIALPAPPAVLAEAQEEARDGNYGALLDWLDEHRNELRREPMDVTVHAGVLEARAHLAGADLLRAGAAYRKLLAKLSRAEKTLRRQLHGADAETVDQRITAMNRNFAEAFFFLGELKRHKLDDVMAPKDYDGPADEKAVERHFASTKKRWVSRWEHLSTRATTEYARMDYIDAVPPLWRSAVEARRAQMLTQLIEHLEALEPPYLWSSDEKASTALEAYRRERSALVDGAKERRDEALESCIQAAEEQDSRFYRYCLTHLGRHVPEAPLPEHAAPLEDEPQPELPKPQPPTPVSLVGG